MRFRSSGAVCEWDAFANKLSTDVYVDVGVWSVAYYKTKTFTFSATTNNLLVNVLGSKDGGTTFAAVESAISVTTGAAVEKVYTDMYTHLKVQVKAAVGGSQGTLATKYFGTWV
jgi:hypothetical protein